MVTMTDIARLSGYSRATVSAALGNKPGVSQKAREKILAVVKEHNYTRNQMAMALVGKSSKLIGLILRDQSNPYFTKIAEGIEKVLTKAGYNILYFSTSEDHQREIEALKTLAAYQVAGVILAPILKGVNLEHIWTFSKNNTPLISIERIPGINLDYVDFDNEKAGFLATEHLIQAGHADIRFLLGPATSLSSEQRAQGFKMAHLHYGLPYNEARLIPCGSAAQDGYQAAVDLLSDSTLRPSALFCFSDLVASGVYKAAHKLSLRIPEDISIIGCDDIDIASILGPSLTTISQSIGEVGCFVAECMIKHIERQSPKNNLAKIFNPKLIERQSVLKIN